MFALLCFCVATEFSVNKDLYKKHGNKQTDSQTQRFPYKMSCLHNNTVVSVHPSVSILQVVNWPISFIFGRVWIMSQFAGDWKSRSRVTVKGVLHEYLTWRPIEYWLAAVVVGFRCDMSCELANFDPSGIVLTSILKLKPKVVVFLKVWAYRCNLVKSHINFKNLFLNLFIAFCFSLFIVLSIYHCCWLIDVFRTSQNDQLYCTVIILESLLIHYVRFKQLLETGVGSLSWES